MPHLDELANCCAGAVELSKWHWTRAHLMRKRRIMRMDDRLTYLRTSLLLGTAFLAGVAIGPLSGLIARHFAVNAGGLGPG